jgi:hypothetical protein
MASTRKSKKVYARMLLQTEQSGTGGVQEQQAVVYVPVLVNSDVYSDELLKACNLMNWVDVPNKRTILQWDLRKSKLLNKIRVSLQKEGEKKRITLVVNKTSTTLEEIASTVLDLKIISIVGSDWCIESVIIPPEKVIIFQTDAEPEASPSAT